MLAHRLVMFLADSSDAAPGLRCARQVRQEVVQGGRKLSIDKQDFGWIKVDGRVNALVFQ
jgi:hypothetical protein